MNKKQQPFFNPELSGFCSQMAMILHSGISPLEGITIMLEDSTSDREKDILQQILDTLQETADFSLSLKETGLFPSYLVHMVQIGEETGTLDEVMSALSEHYEREESIAKSIRNAVTYPMIMIGMMLVVILRYSSEAARKKERLYLRDSRNISGSFRLWHSNRQAAGLPM